MGPYTTRAKSSAATTSSSSASPKSSSSSATPSAPSASYALSAVIVHKGEINSGHYVSYVREGRDWFLFDDSKVVLVGGKEVLAAEAYLLVYVVERLQ